MKNPRPFAWSALVASGSAWFAATGCAKPTSDFDVHNLAVDAGVSEAPAPDPALRYEPATRIDDDNVSAFGDPSSALDLPDPPKSGFRIVAPRRTLEPGGEIETCIAWPFPPAIAYHNVYAARLYATPGLHHSNVISKPIDAARGPSPYPQCNPGASDPFGQLPKVIPDTLFANTTQIAGSESLVFSPGMAFKIDPSSREIATDIHYLNASADEIVVEVAYDFFTMPDELLEHQVVPFALSIDQFLVPPHAHKDVGTDCAVFGGNVVSLMAHTHQYAEEFTADLVGKDATATNVYDVGALHGESEIRVFDPPLDLSETKSIRYDCSFDNTTNHDIRWGIGENEMCVLFGYLYPPESQFVGHAPDEDKACQSLQIGLFR